MGILARGSAYNIKSEECTVFLVGRRQSITSLGNALWRADSRQIRTFISTEESQIDCIAQGFVTCWSGMQVISTVVLWIEARGIRGIAHRSREVDYSVEAAGSFYPVVDGNTFCLTLRRPAGKSLIGQNRGSKDLQSPSVSLRNDLFAACDEFVGSYLCFGKAGNHLRRQTGSWCIRLTDIVCALKENHSAHSNLRKNVALQPRQSIGSPARGITQHPVAADASV